ncbi:MAG TPA: ABC transporter transmembrane domain-containing protein, partial [Reyranellaceae bacterium]|nr:ABC transporter transmembrane domain-containing protein [Reyranellaceae bacterium]
MHIEPRLWKFTEGVRPRIAATTAVGLVAVALGVARLGLLGWLIGEVIAGRELSALILPVALIGLVMVLRGAAEHWRAVMAHETAARVQTTLRRALYDHIAGLGPGTVSRQRSGGLTLSLVEGVQQLETYFGQFLPQFLIALLTPILIFIGIAFIDLPVAAITLAFALVALLAPGLWHRFDVKNSLARQKAYSTFAAEFLDSIQGLATLKAFGQGKNRGDKLEIGARDVFRRTMWVLGTNALARGITDSAIACGAAAALLVGAARVESGSMSLTALLVILMLGIEIFRPMRELRTVLHQGMVGMAAAQGIYQIFDGKASVADAEAARLDGALTPTIAFDNVRFGYPGTRRTVHDGLTFRVAAGERIGLVGPSGGGKSSIVRLLLRFYDPDRGSIWLSGRDLRQLSFEQIRSMISVVNQDTFLFHGTVEENIRLGKPEATQAELEAAARAANIHDFILTLPQRYDTVIGEKGIKLSGGQRQRVAIARALLRDTPILILDEALSAVDAENEAVIQEALDRLMRGRTTLILAHRLSSVIDCDRILVLDGGKVVETGKHDELMRQGGVYAGLMAEQVRESAKGSAAADVIVPVRAESIADTPGGAVKVLTEGIIKAEGLTWYQVVVALMKVILPWKGKLTATFALGVARVIAFIGVGVLSALVVLSLKHGQPYTGYAIALCIVAPLSGVLHWLESWLAHDMAFRLLAEMRIDAFRKLEALSPAYLVRRRTGDLMTLATHDIELVEYFFAHTVAPAFVAILIPAGVLVLLGWASPWLALALAPFLLAVGLSPFLMRKRVDRLGGQAREAAGELSAFAIDSVQGLGEIVAFQQEKRRGAKLDQLSRRHI